MAHSHVRASNECLPVLHLFGQSVLRGCHLLLGCLLPHCHCHPSRIHPVSHLSGHANLVEIGLGSRQCCHTSAHVHLRLLGQCNPIDGIPFPQAHGGSE